MDDKLMIAVEHELADLARSLRRKRDEATRTRRVAGHEERTATQCTFRRLQETALRHPDIATRLERDITSKPRQLTRLSHYCLAIGERHSQDGCRRPGDHSIHKSSFHSRDKPEHGDRQAPPQHRLHQAFEVGSFQVLLGLHPDLRTC